MASHDYETRATKFGGYGWRWLSEHFEHQNSNLVCLNFRGVKSRHHVLRLGEAKQLRRVLILRVCDPTGLIFAQNTLNEDWSYLYNIFGQISLDESAVLRTSLALLRVRVPGSGKHTDLAKKPIYGRTMWFSLLLQKGRVLN